ncbi:taperin [Carlito syrichta]|uniref:Taperin n=1 Tax=Carlito syrichta TaxID=1868482 RepID=A0A3Q0DPA8_CARSF|nr:taperin [Carlito syrichta]
MDASHGSCPHGVVLNRIGQAWPGAQQAPGKRPPSPAGAMKISFNDRSLQTTFEYPSESSLAQEDVEVGEDEEQEDEEDEEEEESGSEKPFSLFLPRATFVGSVGPESPRLPEGGSGLSSYTPKHSVAFSKWQEQVPEQAPREAEPPPREVMLTPASQNDLSDFRSEPALYF